MTGRADNLCAMSASAPKPDRNLALELVRVTEAAAMAAGRWVGRGDKNDADGVAVEAMRAMISSVGMRGTVVIGEGEKDNAPMLFNGEEVGDGTGPECDVAVDPIDGTTLTAKGMNNAIAVLAVSPRGTMYDPSAVFYMDKLVTGPEAADQVDIRLPVKENIARVAKAKGLSIHDVTVVLLDRPRHSKLVEDIRETGARIKYITDGDELIAFTPDAVTVSLTEPEGSSRLRWHGPVASLAPHGDAVRLLVHAAPDLLADLTPAAATELELVPGREVWLSTKATAVSRYPARR